jgi:hypothetical protein
MPVVVVVQHIQRIQVQALVAMVAAEMAVNLVAAVQHLGLLTQAAAAVVTV